MKSGLSRICEISYFSKIKGDFVIPMECSSDWKDEGSRANQRAHSSTSRQAAAVGGALYFGLTPELRHHFRLRYTSSSQSNMERPKTPQTNGNGIKSPTSPLTVSPSSLALTEYAINPLPDGESTPKPRSLVPEEFLLPNGYPDVSMR